MDSKTRTALAENVRRLRDARGLSQTALGVKAGVAQTAVSYIENPRGKSPTLDSIDALAVAFGVPTWTLLIPTADLDPAHLRSLEHLVATYTTLPANGQDQITRVAEAEARYAKAG